MQLLRKRPPYTSRSAAQPPGAGGEPLLPYLVCKAESNPPYFCAGNLLIHNLREIGGDWGDWGQPLA
jgi:hypothetical protein